MASRFVEGERLVMLRGPGNEPAIGNFNGPGVTFPAKATVIKALDRRVGDSRSDPPHHTWFALVVRVDGLYVDLTVTDSDWHFRKLDIVEQLGELA